MKFRYLFNETLAKHYEMFVRGWFRRKLFIYEYCGIILLYREQIIEL